MDGLDELCQVIERNRQVAEDTARLAPEVREAADKAGLWLLAAPEEVGGLELPLPEIFRVLGTVAAADPTVAWHATNSLGMGMLAAALGEAECRAIFAGAARPFGFSGVFTQARARPTGEGYRLEGCWPFMTGAADAEWALVSATVEEEGAPKERIKVRRFVVPLDALEVDDTWQDASAMRGTGSHAVATPAGGLCVPAIYSVVLAPEMRVDRPLYRLPAVMVFLGSAPAVALGVLHRAAAGTIELSGTKISRADGHAHYEDARVQQAVADARAEHWCLTAGYRAILDEMWVAATAGEPLPEELRARFWSTVCLIMDRCRELVSRLFGSATSAVYATHNPVERALRDVHALSATIESFQSLRWASARVMLGHEPRHPAF